MRFKTIKIISNPLKPWAKQTARQVSEYLRQAGYTVAPAGTDLTICVGGDGTILYANHQGKIEGAVLGIGSGRSFICQLTRDNWKKEILPLLRMGKTENRQMLSATSSGKTYTAINDFVIHAKDYRVIELDVRMRGKDHWFEADGIIVSTATGSYAYAYSAGGLRLPLLSKKITVVPICPYKQLFKPSILHNSGTVMIKVNRESAFIVDGIFIRNIRPKEKIAVRAGKTITFIKRMRS